MGSAAFVGSASGAAFLTPHWEAIADKPAFALSANVASRSHAFLRPLVLVGKMRSDVPKIKASESASSVASKEANSDIAPPELSKKRSTPATTFPIGVEELAMQVCEETSIAELKLKIGSFEMYLKRDVGALPDSSPPTIASPTVAPPIPGEPMDLAAAASQPVEPAKLPSTKPSQPAIASSSKEAQIAALEASGTPFTLVPATMVGIVRLARSKGGKKIQLCQEGRVVKEGQNICFIQQFDRYVPVKTDVAGEVLKILVKDGEPIGYGDPIVAILPSFHEME